MRLWIFTTCKISVNKMIKQLCACGFSPPVKSATTLNKWWNIYGPVDFYHLWNQRGPWLNDKIFMGLWIFTTCKSSVELDYMMKYLWACGFSPPMKSAWTLAWLNDGIFMGLWIFTTCEISVDPEWWNIGPEDFYHLWNQRGLDHAWLKWWNIYGPVDSHHLSHLLMTVFDSAAFAVD